MAVSNAITDIALLILPFPILYSTRFDRRQYVDPKVCPWWEHAVVADMLCSKLQLSVLFGIGFITVAITIVRIPLIFMSSVTQSARSLVRYIDLS